MSEPLNLFRQKVLSSVGTSARGVSNAWPLEWTAKPSPKCGFLTDLWHGEPASDAVCELSLMQLEGQARERPGIASELKAAGRLTDWIAGGISATHHTAGRIDRAHNQVRRAICWNDQTFAAYRIRGERRLGGAKRVRELLGGPWADRYTLSHLCQGLRFPLISARPIGNGPIAFCRTVH